uniref:NADH-ubiquinone oxidoreductase chain 4L n=1 Tax=Conaspidia wangi TaxID=2675281 RepID=A0A8E5BTF9_9HYME|nr:NADH dehydrogenase subunit 4L [Conaspidia wangi]QSZ78259.1 NADH dehydrogenase subunit 4L [Conaspidia wangi]
MFIFSVPNLLMMMFLIGFMSFCKNRIHLLMILMSLEFMMLIIYLMLIFFLSLYEMELYFSMIFLTFSVCEGVLGLSVLILMVRMHGNDYFQVLSIL